MKMLFWVFSLTLIFFTGCGGYTSPNAQVLEKQEITCPPPARLEYTQWGKSGLMAICKVKHGPFMAAENGKIRVVGENNNGKPSGEVKWFDANGKLERSEIMK
jgi:hypothetical protein